jgi:hypothetical protein
MRGSSIEPNVWTYTKPQIDSKNNNMTIKLHQQPWCQNNQSMGLTFVCKLLGLAIMTLRWDLHKMLHIQNHWFKCNRGKRF